MQDINHLGEVVSRLIMKTNDLKKAIPLVTQYTFKNWDKYVKKSIRSYTRNKLYSGKDV